MTGTAVPDSPERSPAQAPPRTLLWGALALAALVTAVVAAGLALGDAIPMLERDFKVYDVSGRAVLDGVSPFDVATDDGLLFIYSPFSALLFTAVAVVGLHPAFVLWTFASLLALTASIWLLAGLAAPEDPRRRARYTLLASAAALPTAPVWVMVGNGQINLLLTILVLADLVRRPGRWQGVAIGIAAGVKLTPLIFIPYFLLTGRRRAALVSGATFLATALIGFLALPGPTGQWLTGLAVDTTRMMPPDHGPWNESVRGVLGQLPGVLHAPWFGVAVTAVVGVAGLAVSVWASRRGREAAGILACAVTSLLVSPVSWPHHWVWVVPGVAAWLWWALRRGERAHVVGALAAWALLVASAVITLLDDSPVADVAVGVISLSDGGLLALNSLPVLGGTAFLVVLGLSLRRAEPRLADHLPAS
ncbi:MULTISPECIES: glycosyltransferase 87 family protein [Actinosynnema]|uniref:glycosyltransferase 87 family protein n=1 Tax=Actinosynnema TaxID=40566 RepID=UPI0020A5BE7A|nr:glycosyltransferase 87 family protein [Actinosynnema pretiosum]MCP2094957.1 alpha-1,2-mannosyltransferase [Actinosynnema pretiosum]